VLEKNGWGGKRTRKKLLGGSPDMIDRIRPKGKKKKGVS